MAVEEVGHLFRLSGVPSGDVNHLLDAQRREVIRHPTALLSRGLIGLIEQRHHLGRLRGKPSPHLTHCLGRLPRIDHPEDEQCRADLADRPTDTKALHRVIRLTQSGGVYEAKLLSVNKQVSFDGVTGGSLHVGDNSAVLAKQVIEQGRLADIRATHDSDRDAPLDRLPLPVALGEGEHLRPQRFAALEQLRAGDKVDILLREVQLQLQQGSHPDQPVTQLCDTGAKAPGHLGERHPEGRPICRQDDIIDRLGTTERQLPGEYRPAGKFAPLCHPRTHFAELLDHQREDQR